MPDSGRTYAMMAKPVSSACNLRCAYCYYAGKEALLHQGNGRMSHEVLEAFIRQNLAMHGRDAVVEFAWHGGEPTLAGLPFYEEAVRLEQKYGAGRRIVNTLQTNATLLTDEWCRFFRQHAFHIGVSIDGPEELHNAYRKGADGTGAFEATMRGIRLLWQHGVPFATLTTVNRVNMEHPLKVYRFLRGLSDYLQFLPVVEALPGTLEEEAGQHLATPPGIHALGLVHPVAPFSVTPAGYGDFLCAIWEAWLGQDAGRVHVQLFDVALGHLQGLPSTLCVHDPLCGHSGCVEANGDVYACDRYAFPEYRLGSLLRTPLEELMEKNRSFGMHKTCSLPQDCLDCPYVRLCFGGCPKDRLSHRKNYLCEGYRRFFARVLADWNKGV